MNGNLESLSDRELTAAADTAWGRGETEKLAAIKAEKQRRSGARGGWLKNLLRPRSRRQAAP